MKYIIAGAGEIGSYLAGLLSSSQHSVIVIENDRERLDKLSAQFDISAVRGSANDLELLAGLSEVQPDVFLAVTDHDEVNLVACATAKSLGYPKTLARVHNPQYLNKGRVDFYSLFMADHIICPEWSTAQALQALVQSEGDYACESFAGGAVQMRKIRLGSQWKKDHTPLRQLDMPMSFKVAVIKRYDMGQAQVIFPHGDDYLLVDDELTLLGHSHTMYEVDHYFGLQDIKKESVFITGSSPTAAYLCILLENAAEKYSITWINCDKAHGQYWARQLKKTNLLYEPVISAEFLKSQNANQYDIFLACSTNEHINLTSCALAREIGVVATAAIIQHPSMSELALNLSIQNTICPNDHVANQIVRLASGARIMSVAEVYSHRAELVQLHIGMRSRLTGLPLYRLAAELPKDFLIGAVQHRGKTYLAHGGTVLCPGDLVIAICNPQHLDWIQRMV